jgi:hypothetical protein
MPANNISYDIQYYWFGRIKQEQGLLSQIMDVAGVEPLTSR